MTDGFCPDEAEGRAAPLARDSLPTDVIDLEFDPMPSNQNLSNRPHRNLRDIKKLPTGPPTTRYLTFKVQNLPSLRLLSKNDPMITIWDSYLETYVGTTEVVKQVLTTDFEEVIAVKHYPGVDQTLHCSVFNASGNSVTIKDLIGTSTTSLDALVGLEGADVPMSITHTRDPKFNAKLIKSKAFTVVHLRAFDTYSSVLRSGWIGVRELPLYMGSKEVLPLAKRFMVISKGRISHYRNVYDFFQEGVAGKAPTDKFSVNISDCKVVFEPQEPRLWGVECALLAKRYEFVLTESKDEPPNLFPEVDDSDSSTRGQSKAKQEPDFAQRKALWLHAVQSSPIAPPQAPQRPAQLDTSSTTAPSSILSPSRQQQQQTTTGNGALSPSLRPKAPLEIPATSTAFSLQSPSRPQKPPERSSGVLESSFANNAILSPKPPQKPPDKLSSSSSGGNESLQSSVIPTKEQEIFQGVMEEVLEVVPKIDSFENGSSHGGSSSSGGDRENESFLADDDEETKSPLLLSALSITSTTNITSSSTNSSSSSSNTTFSAKPLPSSPAITRYLTLKVKNLPSLFLIAKPDPMLMLWDSVLGAYIGKTEIIRQVFSAEFEQVFAVKHYANNDQNLTVNVFSVSGEKVSTKDVVGRALVTLDSLLGMEGVDVSVPITNLKDPKMHTKLVRAKSAVVFHLRPEVSLYAVIHSGWVLAREVPAVMQKKDKPPPFVRRFLVVMHGRMQHYKSVIDYFEDTTEKSAGVVNDRVVISLSESGPIVFDQLPKPPGKLALDGRREHAWAVECTLTGKRHEFDIVELASAEAPNLAPDELKEKLLSVESAESGDSNTGRPSISNVSVLDSPRSAGRRERWIQAIRRAIPLSAASAAAASSSSSSSAAVTTTTSLSFSSSPQVSNSTPARARAPSNTTGRVRAPSAPPRVVEKTKEREHFGVVMKEVLDVVVRIEPSSEASISTSSSSINILTSIPRIEAEAEAPPLQEEENKAIAATTAATTTAAQDDSANKLRKKKLPTNQQGVIRYLTFRIKDLPPVRLLTKNDPMVTVWDTHTEKYIGATEVKPQTYSPDFEEVISVCHYLEIDQMLRVGVFNASGSTVSQQDFIGNSVIPLDTLLNFEGSEVPIPISNARDSKLHIKLQKAKSSVIVHLRSNNNLVGILKSGYVNARAVPKKGRPSPWVKRFVVVMNAQLLLFRCVYDFFQDCSQARQELEKVVISLSGRVALIDPLPRLPGIISKGNAWGVDCESESKRYEFDLTEQYIEEFPNLSPQADPSAQRTANCIVQDTKQPDVPPTRRIEWVRAMLVAIPTTIFGVPLAIASARSDPQACVPAPLTIAIRWLDENALTETGLYRIPGGKTEVETLIARFDRGEIVEIPKQYFGGNLASLIVQFIRRLPEGLFTARMAEVFEQMSQDGNLKMLKLLLSKLPKCNFCTLRALIQHLVRVAGNCSVNEMTIENLSICVITSMAQTMNALMTNVDFLFDQPEPLE